MIRRTTIRALLAAASSVVAPAVFAIPAQASLGISSFSVTPSTTQAGGSLTAPGPSLTISAEFSTTDGDSPKDATIALAPGLLANPSVVPLCPTADFNAGWCPDSSQIGSGSITGTAPQFAFTLSLPTTAYLIQPQGSEPARIGLIVTFFNFPVATQTAPVSIRTTPNVGIDIPLTGLPHELDGVPVTIDALHLTISGSVDGQSFTRNPTTCNTVSSTLTVDSYGAPTTTVSRSSSLTATGCGSLPYAPTIAGTVTKDMGDDGIGISATITQQYDEADDQSIELALPASASPRLSALSSGCTNTDLATCPAIGTATVATPLLTNSLTANVVLVEHSGALPTLAILIPPPIGLDLTATPILSGSAVQALVSNVPDIPLSSVTLNLPGGPNSPFMGGAQLCSQAQSFGGSFTGWNGATATPTAPATVTGCSAAPTTSTTAAPPPPTPGATGGSVGTRKTKPAGKPTATIKLTKLAGKAPKLTLTVTSSANAPALSLLRVKLPHGISVDKHGSVTIRLRPGTRSATITLTGPALKVARSLVKKLRHHHTVKLRVVLKIESAAAKATTLRLTAIAR